ncbi:DNA internalization-related competence protein ComEC/Rec2 [Legionella fairfieldensis]|uniref:DNA internalization-related competence protein ComEC/Rec2 n=1 Tax=Legionella fairfieldensis TaxID=45064 RepID=UPI00048ADAEB|nr:DNA internalization-related competence protein ComEC/Rec2 [Legionella fairfieldensis]
MEILCFFAGIVFVYTTSFYPLLFVVIALFLKASRLIIVWFVAACVWASLHQLWVFDKNMPDTRIISNATLVGTVVSIPTGNSEKTQFQFLAKRLNDQDIKATFLLSCYQHCPIFKVGEYWRLAVKLKKSENLANPGSFDYVGWLKARHIRWTGYIKRGSLKLGENTHSQRLLAFRERLALTLNQLIPATEELGILQALTLGVTSNIDKKQWDLFRRTGTMHLMVISGAHIGLIAGFSYWLMKWLWTRFSRLCLIFPSLQIAGIAGILMALFYALLAGFAAPAQRALFAYFFLSLRHFMSYRLTVWQIWRYGLFIVLIYEPHAVLLPGFYLSFIAVSLLILTGKRITGNAIKKTICLQLACLLGLMPLTLYWFSYGAVNGLIANLLAIPLVGFVIVPLALISLFLVQVWAWPPLLFPVNLAIQYLLRYLHWVDSFALVNLNFSFTELLSPLALMLAMFLLLFLPVKAIFPATMVLALAAIFPGHSRPDSGEAEINILDVGQGLAIVVNTAKHTLIYDTGMKFYQGGDMAKLAIIPFLNTLGIKKLDKVIISHPDLDHRGGLASLEEKYRIEELLVDKVAFYHRGKSCHYYPPWQWDGVFFEFLPISESFKDKNNNSCILRIKNAGGRILLTGDIEKKAEDYLITTYGTNLRSEILLIPHHGSKTSSSIDFLKEVAPKYAIISAGFDNRYHFPHQQTLNHLNEQQIIVYNTMNCGMITVKLGQDLPPVPHCYKSSIT